MRKRYWTGVGVGDWKPTSLEKSTIEHIRVELREYGLIEISSTFFNDISNAISNYLAGKSISEHTTPKNARKNLSAALRAAHLLDQKLNELDANSIQLIRESGIAISELHLGALQELICALESACNMANEYPSAGRLPEHDKLWLAVDLLRAVDKHFELTGASTRRSAFESLLDIILETVTGSPRLDIRDLASRAMSIVDGK